MPATWATKRQRVRRPKARRRIRTVKAARGNGAHSRHRVAADAKAQEQVGQKTFTRGCQYFASGRVVETKREDDNWISGIVTGSARDNYQVRIFLSSKDATIIKSERTCPYKHGLSEHKVALALAALADPTLRGAESAGWGCILDDAEEVAQEYEAGNDEAEDRLVIGSTCRSPPTTSCACASCARPSRSAAAGPSVRLPGPRCVRRAVPEPDRARLQALGRDDRGAHRRPARRRRGRSDAARRRQRQPRHVPCAPPRACRRSSSPTPIGASRLSLSWCGRACASTR